MSTIYMSSELCNVKTGTKNMLVTVDIRKILTKLQSPKYFMFGYQ